jgi:hypothetical protein
MTEQDLRDINWTAVFVGFGVDWTFSELVGLLVMAIMLIVKGVNLDTAETLPSDVFLARQIVGVIGALVGGVVAGYIARRRGGLHGLLGSVMGLVLLFCSLMFLGGDSSADGGGGTLTIGDVGFIVLNLVAAAKGGGFGERWRVRREEDSET